jgi:hypothetical protein
MQEVNAMQLALADQKKMLEECTLSADVVAIADGRTKHVYNTHMCGKKKLLAIGCTFRSIDN